MNYVCTKVSKALTNLLKYNKSNIRQFYSPLQARLLHSNQFSFNKNNENSNKEEAQELTPLNINLTSELKIKDLDWISTKVNTAKGTIDKLRLKSKDRVPEGNNKIEKGNNEAINKTYNKWSKTENPFQSNKFQREEKIEQSEIPEWRRRKEEHVKKFKGENWNPTKKISRAGMERIRFLAREMPDEWDLPSLSREFKISPEAVRRILKSKFQPTQSIIEHQEAKRKERRLAFLNSLKERGTTIEDFNKTKDSKPHPKDILKTKSSMGNKWRGSLKPLTGENSGWDKL